MTEQPWNRHAGKYDKPSSAIPKPAIEPAKPLTVIPALSPEEELFAHRGIGPITSGAEDGLPAVEEPEVEVIVGEDAATPSHSALRNYIERVERLDGEIADLRADRSDVLKEAKSEGFDRKALDMVLRRRKMDPAARLELDCLVETYEAALGCVGRGEVWGGELSAAPPPTRRTTDRGRRAQEARALAQGARQARLA